MTEGTLWGGLSRTSEQLISPSAAQRGKLRKFHVSGLVFAEVENEIIISAAIRLLL